MTPAPAEVAATPSALTTSDLFVVSNLGQIRTAALVVRQHPEIEVPRLLLLWSAGNRQLLQRMHRLADDVGLPATPVRLAGAPNAPIPGRMRRMVEIIDGLPVRVWAPRLWLCNTNAFYGYLAYAYSSAGASINLFEEGLGSYRMHTDPPFVREGAGRRLRQLSVQVRSIAASRKLGGYRKVRRIGHHTARFLADTGPGRRVNRALVPQAHWFTEPWTVFDRAVMAFPGLVDPVLVQAAHLERLEMEPDREEIAAREQESGTIRFSEPLLLSQRFGVPYQPWAEAITHTLHSRGIDAVALKHHPRETATERADLTLALLDAGLNVRSDPSFDAWTAEALIIESGTSQVVGITSSTLVYRPYAPWPITYTSIGREILELLERDARVHPGSLVQLQGDLQLFERVYPRLDQP